MTALARRPGPGDGRQPTSSEAPTGPLTGRQPVRNQGSSPHRYRLEPRQHAALVGLAHDIRAALDDAGETEHRTRPLVYGKWLARNWRFGHLLRWHGEPNHLLRRPRMSTLRKVEQRAGMTAGTADGWAAKWPDAIAPEASDGHRAD